MYKLTFKLTKHKGEDGFELYSTLNTEEDVNKYLESYIPWWTERYGTPIKCVKTEKIDEMPPELEIQKEIKDG